MKKRTKKKLLIIIIIIILALTLITFILIKNQKQNVEEERKYCIESSRNVEVCIEIYEPVCGFPIEKTYSNSCFACMDKNVEYYTNEEC